MHNWNRFALRLTKEFALLILLSLLTVCATNLPSYASEKEIWQSPAGNITMTPSAARDFLEELLALRGENDFLYQTLRDERAATLSLIAAVQELRTQIQAERQASDDLIKSMEDDLRKAKRHANRNLAIGGVLAILAIIL